MVYHVDIQLVKQKHYKPQKRLCLKTFLLLTMRLLLRPMYDTHQKIVEDTFDLFFKFGIRSITMDDIARELGVSKKTIYKYVSNKAELVDQCIKVKFKQVTNALKGVADQVDNAIDELFAIDSYFDEMMQQNHPAIMFQLSKYYGDTYKWLDESRDSFLLDIMNNNLQKGLQQGLYRRTINQEHIAYIYLAHTAMMSGQTNVPNEICHSPDFHRSHLEYHIRGIASEAGLTYLNQKLNHK
jgi:AcrR family transcriptional regulator